MGLLDGRSAAITGAAQGIGFAIAERLVSEGARVVLGDKDQAAAEIAAAALGGFQKHRRCLPLARRVSYKAFPSEHGCYRKFSANSAGIYPLARKCI